MKKILLTFLIVFNAMFVFADVNVSYDEIKKILTVTGNIDASDIRPYNETTTLVIQDVAGLNNMANQYGQCLPNLTKLILPTNVTEIPMQTFKNCKKLVSVNWDKLINLKTIGEEAFMSTAIGPTFYVPNSVEEIKRGAFEDCDSIKTLIFDEGSQIQHIHSRAFYQDENNIEGKLSDVYIDVKPMREIVCDKGAFDKYHACAQTQVGTVTTRLHYPSELFEYYVGTYKNNINGGHLIEQNHIDQAYNGAENGWQQFMSSGIPIGSESLYRSFSDNVAYRVPDASIIQVYIVVNYDKAKNEAQCIQMSTGDIIPAKTGVIVHSNVVSTVYLEYVANNTIPAYDNELYPDNLYQNKYANYLKSINGVLHIDNVEIVNGQKTYRNYFFNKGTTAASRPGPDWKAEYAALGWGFFRAVSANYRVFNKAFLHLPASMTEATSAHIYDSGTLPQDGAQPSTSAKESFGIYIINGDDMLSTQETTSDIKETIVKQDNNYYTLQGVIVENPVKGIYIKNNKKVVVK